MVRLRSRILINCYSSFPSMHTHASTMNKHTHIVHAHVHAHTVHIWTLHTHFRTQRTEEAGHIFVAFFLFSPAVISSNPDDVKVRGDCRFGFNHCLTSSYFISKSELFLAFLLEIK